MQWSGLFGFLRKQTSRQTEELVIVSPYISTSTLRELSKSIQANSVRILTSWAESNLIQGSSSLDLFLLCQEKGWELRILNTLHAKIYAIPREEMWIGSANLTASGMGTSSNPNDEVLGEVKPNESDWTSLENLLSAGRVVDDTLHQAYSEWLSDQTLPEITPIQSFIPPIDSNSLSPYSLPRTFTPTELYDILHDRPDHSGDKIMDAEHDLSVLRVSFIDDKNEFFRQLQLRFFSLPIVKKMLADITEEWMRFGQMRINMREVCGGKEKTNRDDLTMFTQNLYEWKEELDTTEEFEFGVPRYSQLIRRRKTP